MPQACYNSITKEAVNMRKPNKRLVEMAEKLKKYDLNKPINRPINKEPVKHESIKPGHMQARNCSAEYWFK